MGKFKDKLYHFLVEKNPRIREEYQGYVNLHQDEHQKNRKKSWRLLLKLNWHYRILRRKKRLLPPPPAKKRLPYLGGSESEGHKRTDICFFTKNLLQYDVVSFDIFDTLVLRPFSTPQDLFTVIGNKLKIMNFKTLRIDAEREARDIKRVNEGHTEITIYDIYERISRRTGIDVELGVKTELMEEKTYCFANPYMQKVFKMLKDQGKEIIIVSDMYIPHDAMEDLLKGCGYEGYTKLYVSCDYECNKRNGGLYKNVQRDFKGKTIIHVGDNRASDVLSAEKAGIATSHYQNCHERGGVYRADGMSDLVGSLYAGIVNTHLHNGLNTYTPHYEYGFTYGGLYIVGFCNWIYRRAKEEGVDKILFLSRDCDIYQKVFNQMFDDMPNEYVYWSRIANTKYTIEHSRDDFLTRIARHKAYSTIPCTFGDILDSFDLSFLKPKLKKHHLSENQLHTTEHIKRFEDFLIEHYGEIEDFFKEETEVAHRMFKRIIGDSKKVAIIDVGWIGSGPMGIKYLVEQKWKMDCEVRCYMVASMHRTTSINLNELMNDDTQIYMFSRMYNRSLYDTHKNTNAGTNCIYFELLSQACQPSFSGYAENGDYLFDVPEVENYKMTEAVQRGILDFASTYLKFSSTNKYLRNISGYDAYMPYRFAIRDIAFIKGVLKNASFSRGVGVNLKSQSQETVDDILKSVKL